MDNQEFNPIDANWTNEDGTPAGGVSTGIGYTISWQRGALNESGRNGAFLIDVLKSCARQLIYYQKSRFNCEENDRALECLYLCIEQLESRRNRRKESNILGTHIPD